MSATPAVKPGYAADFGGNAAENYERYFVATIGTRMADLLLDATTIQPGDRVLDVACGTGIVARRAAERVGPTGTVAGVDINPGMLEVARTLAESAGTSIRWYESSAEGIPLPDESFDLVTCELGLMFVADKGAALREMRRVLAPGGRLAIGVPRPNPFFRVLDDALAKHIDPGVGAFVETVFSVNERLLEELLREARFTEVGVRVAQTTVPLPPAGEFMWHYIKSTPMAEFVARAGAEQVAALEREVITGWQPWTGRDGTGLAYEQELVVGTARR